MKTIALLDNEKSILTVFSLMLEKRGYRVFAAENTGSCRQILESEAIDVLIAECMLPEDDVLGFVKRLKTDPKFGELPVIFLSGYGTYETVKTALDSGGDGFLHKPCRIDAICEAVEKNSPRRE